MIETRAVKPISFFLESRLIGLMIQRQDLEWLRIDRRRRLTLYAQTDSETIRRMNLMIMSPGSNAVFIDEEGRVYVRRWQDAKIGENYHIYGPVQRGRDYAEKPLQTKTPKRLIAAYYMAGMDVGLRATARIRDRYLSDQQDLRGEVRQALSTLDFAYQLKQSLDNFDQLSKDQILDVGERQAEFLERYGYLRVRNPDKRRIRELLSGNVLLDSLDRRNPLRGAKIIEAVVRLATKRLFVGLPAVASTFGKAVQALEFERDRSRENLFLFQRRIDQLALFESYNPEEVWGLFQQMSKDLYRSVRIRPYVLPARKAIELLGAERLPEDTIAGRVQRQLGDLRASKKERGMGDLLKSGDYEGVRKQLIKISEMVGRVLDLHEDYSSVKLSDASKNRANIVN